jgi:hypothetical protein
VDGPSYTRGNSGNGAQEKMITRMDHFVPVNQVDAGA